MSRRGILRRVSALLSAILICICMQIGVIADTETSAADNNQMTEPAETEDFARDETFDKNVQIYILVGSVIGAMVVVTLIYRKKDEIKYL